MQVLRRDLILCITGFAGLGLEHLKEFRRNLPEATHGSLGIVAVCVTVVTAHITFQRLLVRELLLDLCCMFESLVVTLDQICCIQAAPNFLRKTVKRKKTGLCMIKDLMEPRIAFPIFLQESIQFGLGLFGVWCTINRFQLSQYRFAIFVACP